MSLSWLLSFLRLVPRVALPSRFVDPVPGPAPAGLAALPVEPLLSIAELSSAETLTCLALTCQRLYALFPPRPTVDKSFLLLLEKDVPALYYCYHCGKLHPRRRRRDDNFSPLWKIAGRLCNYRDKVFMLAAYYLPCVCARLVMRGHLNGAPRGLPLSCIEIEYRLFLREYDVEQHHVWRARIIDDELFLRSTYTIRQRQGNGQKLRQPLDSFLQYVCRHLYTHKNDFVDPDSLGRRIQGIGGLDESNLVVCATFEKCHTCQTDVKVKVAWHHGWVNIIAYRSLGNCLDPSDEKWICHCRYYHPLLSRKRGQSLPGAREKWLDDEEGQVEEIGAR
jgi:hypothetical protein